MASHHHLDLIGVELLPVALLHDSRFAIGILIASLRGVIFFQG
ncbi:Uncharacterised protein [Vibrio cholerae]|nr:Uncharacterised protein [Vibrio cholerae]CSC85516.1 Uncharacterised protein [Vibrio cholerae]